MAGTKSQLESAAAAFFAELRRVRASGGATGERSVYAPLAALLGAIGAALKPRVFCVGELADQGAGHPDFGLYAAKQAQRGKPRPGQAPERGVVEVKPADDDAWLTAVGEQVSRYWGRYPGFLIRLWFEGRCVVSAAILGFVRSPPFSGRVGAPVGWRRGVRLGDVSVRCREG